MSLEDKLDKILDAPAPLLLVKEIVFVGQVQQERLK